jgi:phospholipid/cholesterol/gamma-HCH transport system permease protein
MKVNEEIDALETMALDPVRFLVRRNLLSMLLMMPCLTIWADFMGVVGGPVFGMAAAGFTFKTYIWRR